MRHLTKLAAIAPPVFLLMASVASAQTVGDRIKGLVTDAWNPLFLLASVACGLLGLFLFSKGLMKLAAASSQSAQSNHSSWGAGLAYLAVAAALIALPDAAGMGMTSILGNARGGGNLNSSGLDYSENMGKNDWLASINGSVAGVGNVENCLQSDTPAACMANNIAVNVIPIAVYALFAMVFILGFVMFAQALVEMAKSSEGGGQHSKGGFTKIITSILVMNAPLAFALLTQTMLGQEGTITSGGLAAAGNNLLTYTSGSPLEIIKKYEAMIGSSFTILTFFGAWAFVRGILMIKATSEGRGQGTMGMAGVYIVAGVMLANAKLSTCYILSTVGGTPMAVGFCS